MILVSWVFFRSDNLSDAISYLGAMAGVNQDVSYNNVMVLAGNKTLILLVVGIIFSVPLSVVFRSIRIKTKSIMDTTPVAIGADLLVLTLLFLSAIEIAADTYNPFIYFRF